MELLQLHFAGLHHLGYFHNFRWPALLVLGLGIVSLSIEHHGSRLSSLVHLGSAGLHQVWKVGAMMEFYREWIGTLLLSLLGFLFFTLMARWLGEFSWKAAMGVALSCQLFNGLLIASEDERDL